MDALCSWYCGPEREYEDETVLIQHQVSDDGLTVPRFISIALAALSSPSLASMHTRMLQS
jgi:hypothetical protein